jgi:GNAT superfamily N-acetyltransferase
MVSYIDLLGYVASFIILISLTMKSLVRLRWINAFGSLLFVVFAFLTKSTPTIFMNLGIVAIDLFFIWRITRNKNEYKLIKAERGSAFLDYFYQRHRKEIDAIFGETSFASATGFSYFVCNGEIAGIFAWRENSPTECQILIDFVTPRYRDTKIGSYFFRQQLPYFREKGYLKFVYREVGERHWKYLAKIGFTSESMGSFSKEIE